MPEPRGYTHIEPLDVAAFTRRLHRIRDLVPVHHPGWHLAGVTLSISDLARLVEAMGDARAEPSTKCFDIEGVYVSGYHNVEPGHVQVSIRKPELNGTTMVRLRC